MVLAKVVRFSRWTRPAMRPHANRRGETILVLFLTQTTLLLETGVQVVGKRSEAESAHLTVGKSSLHTRIVGKWTTNQTDHSTPY